ncbi:hypothetical protein BV898_11434 [Hypsibius exemplaris]|uniref:Receptor ligand binding region domain-containing protein n=1 Tax=Hypsibius exemplaris TaxID=2072580 RepID=A0A1W0WGJ1_HYPEX|nr:hypothetical protein BV898_11434 [Hypsibius exemplaris]
MITMLIYSVIFGCTLSCGHARLPRIALATTTIMVPEANTSNNDAIQTSGPAIDLGVEHLKLTYGAVFNFSHTYLMDPSRPTVLELQEDVQNFAAKFVYQNNADADSYAFLSSCTVEQNKILSFTQATSILLGCSGGSVPVSPTESNGHCFGTSIFPGTSAMKFIYNLLLTHEWTNITGLVDLRTIDGEFLSRGYRQRFQLRFNGLDPSLKFIRYNEVTYHSSLGYPEIEKALNTLKQTSRVVFLFGSGRSALMVLRTAERLGMITGEYVFIMLTFNRFGTTLDNVSDAWWKVTDDTDNSTTPLRGYVSRSTIVISFRSPYGNGISEPIRQLRSRIVANARSNYNMTYPRGEVQTFLYGAYEMYQIYGMVLNETYIRTGRLLEGLEMATLIRNRTFHLPTGVTSFSASGERMIDMIGEIVDPRTGVYVPGLLYNALTEKVSNISDMEALWPGGMWPPPNEPKCGFLANRCYGRPATAVTPRNIEAVDCYITENPRATWEEIQIEIGIGSAALDIILHHELGLKKLCARWVPHLLQEGQKQARVDFALKILSRCRKNPELFLRRILTEDESRMYYDPMTKRMSMMWVRPGQPRPTIVRCGRSVQKSMLLIFFNYKGVFFRTNFTRSPGHKAVNSLFYVRKCLQKVVQKLWKKRPKSGTRGIYLLQDNASCHTSALNKTFLRKHKLVTLPHPPNINVILHEDRHRHLRWIVFLICSLCQGTCVPLSREHPQTISGRVMYTTGTIEIDVTTDSGLGQVDANAGPFPPYLHPVLDEPLSYAEFQSDYADTLGAGAVFMDY